MKVVFERAEFTNEVLDIVEIGSLEVGRRKVVIISDPEDIVKKSLEANPSRTWLRVVSPEAWARWAESSYRLPLSVDAHVPR